MPEAMQWSPALLMVRTDRMNLLFNAKMSSEVSTWLFSMNPSNNEPVNAEPLNLRGVRILLVEDSWNVGVALKSLLRSLGADVAGPAATTADAERLIAEQIPDVGIVDYNLRGGELANSLIDSMNTQGIRVIVLSGYSTVPLSPEKAASVLQKPVVEAQLIAALRPVAEEKAASREE
jgi:DNA-binding NtrC family response regulator